MRRTIRARPDTTAAVNPTMIMTVHAIATRRTKTPALVSLSDPSFIPTLALLDL